MSNEAHLLPDRVRVAAQAIANSRLARLGLEPHDLDQLAESTFRACVADAQAVLGALEALPPAPRKASPVNAVDASALRLETGASRLAVVALDRAGRGRAVVTADGHAPATRDHPDGNALWAAVASVLRTFPDDPPPTSQEPTP